MSSMDWINSLIIMTSRYFPICQFFLYITNITMLIFSCYQVFPILSELSVCHGANFGSPCISEKYFNTFMNTKFPNNTYNSITVIINRPSIMKILPPCISSVRTFFDKNEFKRFFPKIDFKHPVYYCTG